MIWKRRFIKRVPRPAYTLRRITGAFGGLPDFIIIGAGKAGTSSLFSYLSQHPRILPSYRKEPHYFDCDFEKSLLWYRSHFDLRWRAGLRFEASTTYIFFRAVAKRILSVLPQVKIIVVLRNPVHRAWSQYRHNVFRMKREVRSFEDAIRFDLESLERDGMPLHYDPQVRFYSYVRRGIYVDQLAPYIRLFGADQVLVLRSEDMFDNPQSTVNEVFRFLRVEEFTLNDLTAKNVGSQYKTIPQQQHLEGFYREHNQRLSALLNRDMMWT